MSDIPPRSACEAAVLAALDSLGGKASRPDIMSAADRLGQFTAAQRATPAPASKARYGTYLAYNLSWALYRLHDAGLVSRAAPSVWQLSDHGRQS